MQQASIRGILIREMIRVAIRTPILKNGGLFTTAAKLAHGKSFWKCPKNCTCRKVDCGGAPAELLELNSGVHDKVILQLHGGAYLIGFLDMYRKFAYRYLKLSGGVSVLSPDYRIAPKYHYPAALDDAFSAWNWLLKKGYKASDILLVGDSAGGNLALALTLKLRESGFDTPNALVLMSPWTDMTSKVETRRSNFKKDPMFGKYAGDKGANDIRKSGNPYAGNTNLFDIHLSPIYADLSDFPPMLIQVGDWEMLLDDARIVANNALNAGVDTTLMVYPGMFHVFQAFTILPESKHAWKAVGAFIRKSFDKQGGS